MSFLILIIFSVQCWSESDCTSVDNETPAMGPVRNQAGLAFERWLDLGDSNLCFAFASADLISHEVGYPVSALDIALQYYFAHPSHLNLQTQLSKGGGFVGPALMATIDAGGFCSEQKVKSGPFGKLGWPISVKQALLNATNLKCDTEKCERNLSDVQKIFPELSQNSVSLKESSLSFMQRLSNLDSIACPREVRDLSISWSELLARTAISGHKTALVDFLDQQLNAHHVAAIVYNPQLIPWISPLLKDQSSGFLHASTVVARRWNPADGGHCEYRIRDSYGPTCLGSPIANCHRGENFVQREDLQKALNQVITVKGKSNDSL